MRATLILLPLAAALLAGCLQEQRYVQPEAGGVWVAAIREDTPAAFTAEDGGLFLSEARVELPFREPTERELEEMMDVGDVLIPYETRPFLERGDVELLVDWTVSNLSDQRVRAVVVINGFNEFHEYLPQVTVDDDELIADFSGWEVDLALDAGERRSGTVREEELDEIAVDLASVVNGQGQPVNANQVVYFQNQSSRDRRSMALIPDIVPALHGLRVGVRTTAAVPVLLEFTVRVRDVRGVLWQGNTEAPWEAPVPVLFTPADAAGMPAATP